MNKPQFNRPAPAIRVLSVLLLVAPLVVLILSFMAADARGWWRPGVFVSLVGAIEFFDWFLFLMVMLAGAVMLKQHKTTWLYAGLILVVAAALNVITFREPDGQNMLAEAWNVQIGFSIFLAVSVLVIINFSRYPYLDRRSGWLMPAAERFDITLPVTLKSGKGTVEDAVCENVSATGCRLRLNRDWKPADDEEFVVVQFPEFGKTRIKAMVVLVQGPVIRLKFRRFIDGDKKAFAKWIQDKGDAVA